MHATQRPLARTLCLVKLPVIDYSMVHTSIHGCAVGSGLVGIRPLLLPAAAECTCSRYHVGPCRVVALSVCSARRLLGGGCPFDCLNYGQKSILAGTSPEVSCRVVATACQYRLRSRAHGCWEPPRRRTIRCSVHRLLCTPVCPRAQSLLPRTDEEAAKPFGLYCTAIK